MEIDYDIILTGEQLEMVEVALESYRRVCVQFNSPEEIQIIDELLTKFAKERLYGNS